MTEATEIQILPPDGALPAFPTDEDAAKAIVTEIAERARAHQADVTKARGRQEIASLAHKIARTKTAMDGAGKELVADAKKKIAEVDAVRRLIRNELDKLKEEVRRPLTEWEEAKEKREAEIEARFSNIKANGTVAHGASSSDIEQKIGHAEGWLHYATADYFDDRADEAAKAIRDQVAMLKVLRDNALEREERDRELERLRREEAERLRREEAERKEREEAERREREEREAEQSRQQEELEKARREAEEAKAAAERAAREAEEAAERERQRIERERQEQEARAKAEAEAEQRRKDDEARTAEQRGRAKARAADALEDILPEIDAFADDWTDFADKLAEAIADGRVANVKLEVGDE